MLSKKILRQVKKADKIDTPRSTIEFLLVASGAKPGDVIDLIKTKKVQDEFKKVIEKTPNVNWFTNTKIMSLNVYYYNTEIVSGEFIEEFKNADKEYFSIYEGILFGYPPCCILSNESGNTIKKRMPATEHYWCSENCKKSIKLQKKYASIVEEYLPKYSKMIKEKSLMDLEIYNLKQIKVHVKKANLKKTIENLEKALKLHLL